MASTEKCVAFFAIVCHAGTLLFMPFFFCSVESASVPNCIYPFNTYRLAYYSRCCGFLKSILTKQIFSSWADLVCVCGGGGGGSKVSGPPHPSNLRSAPFI